MTTQRFEFKIPKPRRANTVPLAIVSVAMTGLLALAVSQQGGTYGSLDRANLSNVQDVSFSALDLSAALERSCEVTGCDATDLTVLFQVSLPILSDAELASAEALTQAVAAQSEDTLRRFDAAGADRPALRARLVAQAEADAAVAQFHAAERTRRTNSTSG